MFTGTFDGKDYFKSTKEIEAYFSAIHARVGFNPFHADMAGGGNQTVRHSAGMVLSRLYFWGTPNQRGHRRQRIYREGEYWTAMSERDWWEDVRLSRSQVVKAKDVLAAPFEETAGPFKGFKRGPLIEVRKWKWARPGKRQGVVTHYRILWENYHAALQEISSIFAGIIESVDQEAAESDLHDSDNQKTRETDTQETRESMDTQKTRESLTLESSIDSKTLESDDGKSDSISSSSPNGHISKVVAEITQKNPTNQQVLDVVEAFESETWITPKLIALWAEHLWPDERPPNAKHPAPWPGQLQDGVIRNQAKLQELEDYGY